MDLSRKIKMVLTSSVGGAERAAGCMVVTTVIIRFVGLASNETSGGLRLQKWKMEV